MLQSILRLFETWSKLAVVLLALNLVFVVFSLDTLFVGDEISFSIFYLLPIAIASWFLGRAAGIGFSLLSAAAWRFADVAGGVQYSSALIGYWNALAVFGFFAAVTLALAAQRAKSTALTHAKEREREICSRDPLTGLLNSYGFFNQAEAQLRLAMRSGQPTTVVVANVDRLRAYNDHYGRRAGDALLTAIGEKISELLRPSDLAGRVGGDAFAILLTGIDAAAARSLVTALQAGFEDVQSGSGRHVQVSIGAIVSTERGETVNTLLDRAEQLMYSVKDAGGNNARFKVPGSAEEPMLTAWRSPRAVRSTSAASVPWLLHRGG